MNILPREQSRRILLCYITPILILLLPGLENEDGDRDATTTIVSGCAAGLIVITIVIIGAYIMNIRQRRKREEDDKKAMAGSGPGQNRFSADDSSLLEGGWEEIGKHSCSTYK